MKCGELLEFALIKFVVVLFCVELNVPEKENRKLEGPKGSGDNTNCPSPEVLHEWVNQAVLFMGEPFPSDELGIYYTFIMNNSYHKSTRNRMWKNLSRAPKTSVRLFENITIH